MTMVETAERTGEVEVFRVSLEAFDGPFDLLLSLISKHELDITEIALAEITDEFIAYLARFETTHCGVQDLDRASEFLVVAVTLLDLKLARLLPQSELVDAEDVELLEARDLLFARLLQYRAFKLASVWFRDRIAAEHSRHPRTVPLEQRYRQSVPQLRRQLSALEFAALAAVTLAPRTAPEVNLEHIHDSPVSFREQVAEVVSMLRHRRKLSFRQLVAGVDKRGVLVARFLVLLELYRYGVVEFAQFNPLGELRVEWIGEHVSDADISALGAEYV